MNAWQRIRAKIREGQSAITQIEDEIKLKEESVSRLKSEIETLRAKLCHSKAFVEGLECAASAAPEPTPATTDVS